MQSAKTREPPTELTPGLELGQPNDTSEVAEESGAVQEGKPIEKGKDKEEKEKEKAKDPEKEKKPNPIRRRIEVEQ
ncbi:hypothetical protein K2173_004335 [Erythroxylum novogranatense]|uniref:Uncharacterized protein n=1 Tax=Erythroxylum novogranatense TaxID=1862640 RepID=A0AAV8T5I4_9ROSI|nr:hypothetical protein K2173_004335 [Erythroxylum novogranatense]